MRLDKYLKVSRLIKRRTVANEACDAERVTVNPAYGTDPRKIASGTAALTMQNKNASLTFVNEKSRYDRYSHNDSIKNTIPVSFS